MWSLNFSLGSANRPELQVLKLDLVLKLFVQLMDHEVESDRSSFLLVLIMSSYLNITIHPIYVHNLCCKKKKVLTQHLIMLSTFLTCRCRNRSAAHILVTISRQWKMRYLYHSEKTLISFTCFQFFSY